MQSYLWKQKQVSFIMYSMLIHYECKNSNSCNMLLLFVYSPTITLLNELEFGLTLNFAHPSLHQKEENYWYYCCLLLYIDQISNSAIHWKAIIRLLLVHLPLIPVIEIQYVGDLELCPKCREPLYIGSFLLTEMTDWKCSSNRLWSLIYGTQTELLMNLHWQQYIVLPPTFWNSHWVLNVPMMSQMWNAFFFSFCELQQFSGLLLACSACFPACVQVKEGNCLKWTPKDVWNCTNKKVNQWHFCFLNARFKWTKTKFCCMHVTALKNQFFCHLIPKI